MCALPAWCEPLPDSAQMRAIDRWAIEQRGVPSLELMERAGTAVAAHVERVVPDGHVAVVCGKGNNGGDGLVVARLLRQRGRRVTVVCACDPAELSGDALANLERLPGEPPLVLGESAAPSAPASSAPASSAPAPSAAAASTPAQSTAGSHASAAAAVVTQALGTADGIVDALLGTGFQGEPRGVVAQAIEAINAAGALVVSVDVPSGVDASTGTVAAGTEATAGREVAPAGAGAAQAGAGAAQVGAGAAQVGAGAAQVGTAVRAQVTVTFHAAKPGLWIAPGKEHAGEVIVADIGIPRGAPVEAAAGLASSAALELLPRRTAASTKFTSGHLVVAGGSAGLMGAPALAALAGMRAGAGYVTVCVPRSQAQVLDVQLLEVMTRWLPDEADGSLVPEGVREVLQALSRAGALVLGPGIGRQPSALAFARELAAQAPLPLLLDADGLNAHAGRLSDLAGRPGATVLTPHAGELARLLEVDSAEVQRERLRHARAASAAARAVVVLKGDDTLIAAPDGCVAVSPGGAPALASAGSGDVLSGVVGALLAQGLHPFEAAAAGVLLHVRAGRAAARRAGAAEGVIASDVIAALPAARGAEAARGTGPARGAEPQERTR